MKSRLILYLKGVAMGAADIVPGVSGGTIALITGIYEELITTIKNINLDLFKSFFASGYKKFWIELNGNFLITLLLGIFTSVILLAQVIVFLLENHEYKLWGFFFGLIVASAVLILKDIQSFSINLAFLVFVGIISAGAISLSNSFADMMSNPAISKPFDIHHAHENKSITLNFPAINYFIIFLNSFIHMFITDEL